MALHCTYQRPNGRYHKVYIDYQEVTAFDVSNGIASRVFEQRTEDRIAWLRQRYAIPDEQMPPDEWLWLDESLVSPAAMAFYACNIRRRATLARTIRDRNPKHLPPSLIQLGYVKTRYIARRSRYATPARVFTELHHDHEGKTFVIVDDYQGYYLDAEGELHCSVEEGYGEVTKQFLFCFETFNEALARLDGSTPPTLPRWSPTQQEASPERGHRNNVVSHSDEKENTSTNKATLGGNLESTSKVSVFTGENTIDDLASSMVTKSARTDRNSIDFHCSAPWTAATLIALSGAVLSVPDPATCDQATWHKEWQRPAELLLAATSMLSPQLAWERIDLATRWMTDDTSPSWWRTGRKKQTPTTLRHVEAHYRQYYDDYKKSSWHPATTTPYDGPPLTYETGYTGITQEIPEPSVIVEEPEVSPRPAWMSREEATELCYAIWDVYPTLNPALTPVDGVTDRWYASVQWGPQDWHDFRTPEEWRLPSPEVVDRIDQALRYAAERNAIPTEVGVIDQLEPSPIIMEATPDSVAEEAYVSMEEISGDLERGLRPLPSSSSVDEVATVVEISQPVSFQNEPYEPAAPTSPQGKTGMSLRIAAMLLAQIESAGYTAETVPISDDRAMLSVEVSPGQWIDIDSGVAWQRHLKSVAQSPPADSVASVIAMESMGSAMEVAQ